MIQQKRTQRIWIKTPRVSVGSALRAPWILVIALMSSVGVNAQIQGVNLVCPQGVSASGGGTTEAGSHNLLTITWSLPTAGQGPGSTAIDTPLLISPTPVHVGCFNTGPPYTVYQCAAGSDYAVGTTIENAECENLDQNGVFQPFVVGSIPVTITPPKVTMSFNKPSTIVSNETIQVHVTFDNPVLSGDEIVLGENFGGYHNLSICGPDGASLQLPTWGPATPLWDGSGWQVKIPSGGTSVDFVLTTALINSQRQEHVGVTFAPSCLPNDPYDYPYPYIAALGYYPELAGVDVTVMPPDPDDETGLGPCCGEESPSGGEPINFSNGNTYIQQSDIALSGLGGGLHLTRTWNSKWPQAQNPSRYGMFGPNWRSTYEEALLMPGGLAKYSRSDGSFWTFALSGPLTAPANRGATLKAGANSWTISDKDGTTRVFNSSTGSLTSISDRNGNTTQLSYDSQNRLVTVIDAAGRHLYFAYGNSNFPRQVTSVSSDVGISLSYTYDAQGRLASYTKQDGTTISFTYDANSMITAVLDQQGKVLESHTYDNFGNGLTSSRAGGVDAVTVTYPSGP